MFFNFKSIYWEKLVRIRNIYIYKKVDYIIINFKLG